jgi:DNA-binding NarL/FixJ family response regulator
MKKILIIEDEPQTRSSLKTILEMEGYKTFAAANGQLGVELARKEIPDLILCDVSMPEMDGYRVLEAMRGDAVTTAIPFIFLTAKSDRKEQRAGMDLGADDYLIKPAGAMEVLTAIKFRLQRHAEREEAAQRSAGFNPDFSSPVALEKALGLTPREAEVLLWIAQGKSNGEIGTILGTAENTVKRHVQNIFEKLGIDSRNAATVRALEILSSPLAKKQ